MTPGWWRSGHHNLGNAARDLGGSTQVADHLRAALDAYAERDDRWSLAHLFEDVARVAPVPSAGTHDLDAVRLLGAAQRVREEIGAPRFAPTEAALERGVGAGPQRRAERGGRLRGAG